MKIALTGAHGTGKTTLANYLKSILTGDGIVVNNTPEVPRVICDMVDDREFFRRGKNTLLKQNLILIGQLATEYQFGCKSGLQICDRTLFDHWAYTLNLFESELIHSQVQEVLEALVAKHCFTYDKIFYIPIEFEPIDDGIRESDSEFQQAIDATILALLNKYQVSYIKVTGTVAQRAETILSDLQLKNHI